MNTTCIITKMRLEISDLKKADIFVQCFQNMKTFTESINVIFDSEHMFIQCMDSTMVLIMELKLPSSWFDVYKVDEPVTIGLLTNLWSKVLGVRDKTHHILLNTEEKEDHVSVLFNQSNNKMVFDKSFEVPLISLDTDMLQIPEKEYPAEFTLPSTLFGSMVTQLKQFGDNMYVECTEEHIQLVADSQDFGKMKTHIPIEDLDEYAIDEGGKINCSFGLRMLHNVCSYQKIAETVSLGVSDNFPLKIEYNMSDNAMLVFYLAPRMED